MGSIWTLWVLGLSCYIHQSQASGASVNDHDKHAYDHTTPAGSHHGPEVNTSVLSCSSSPEGPDRVALWNEAPYTMSDNLFGPDSTMAL